MKIAILFLGFLFNFTSFAHAEIKESERISIHKSFLSLDKSQSPAATVELFKDRVPQELFILLRNHISELKEQKLPTVKYNDGDTVDFISQNHVIPLKIISVQKQIIEVNAKVIDLSQLSSWEEKLQKVISAIPKDSKTSLIKFFIPEANADNSLLRVTGGGGVALGASLFAAGTVVAASTGVGIILVFGALWRDGICSDMSDDVVKCVRVKTLLDRSLIENASLKSAMQKKMSPPACEYPKNSLSKDDEHDVYEMMKPLLSNYNEISRKLPLHCEKSSDTLKNCLDEISIRSRYLCFDIGGGATNAFLPKLFQWPSSEGTPTQSLKPAQKKGTAQ